MRLLYAQGTICCGERLLSMRISCVTSAGSATIWRVEFQLGVWFTAAGSVTLTCVTSVAPQQLIVIGVFSQAGLGCNAHQRCTRPVVGASVSNQQFYSNHGT